MPVKISKLWKDVWFQNQSEITKLLYIYLSTSPDLNSVGVFSPNLEVVCLEVGCQMDDLRQATKKLVDKKYIYVKKFEDTVYFVVPAHFSSVPKSESSVARVQKALSTLPKGLVSFLGSIGITTNSKVKTLIKPTAKEVTEYCISHGHLIKGEDFVNFYEEQSERYGKKGVWVDSRGTQVRDWKAKARRNWFKDENKIKVFKDAPKGFEVFYILVDDKPITPDGWRNGKPWSKSVAVDIELKKEYKKMIS